MGRQKKVAVLESGIDSKIYTGLKPYSGRSTLIHNHELARLLNAEEQSPAMFLHLQAGYMQLGGTGEIQQTDITQD